MTAIEGNSPDSGEVCGRCGGDHSWCQTVRDDEYGPAPVIIRTEQEDQT